MTDQDLIKPSNIPFIFPSYWALLDILKIYFLCFLCKRSSVFSLRFFSVPPTLECEGFFKKNNLSGKPSNLTILKEMLRKFFYHSGLRIQASRNHNAFLSAPLKSIISKVFSLMGIKELTPQSNRTFRFLLQIRKTQKSTQKSTQRRKKKEKKEVSMI